MHNSCVNQARFLSPPGGASRVANIKLYSSYVPVDPLSPFLSNVELLCSRYRRMSFPFVGELISVLAFKVLRATTIVGVLTRVQGFSIV